ncbi:MAG TPA: DUF4956 domain-containing protein [Lachnospiraceae bacterium]|nr:DUF4956 domain-containing protein [Lachnospiraceae bacterium]
MLSSLFTGVLESSEETVTAASFLLCVGTSLAIGLFLTFLYSYKSRCSKSFIVTLAILPAVVCMVIMMVNGNLGAGVAVAGTFSLVRFRSAPGSAKEISAIFIAMAAGLAAGMGYLGYAVTFSVIVGVLMAVYSNSNIGNGKSDERQLKITIPENLDYTGVFDDLFEKYTTKCELEGVKTASMGSLFKLTYDITLKNIEEEKLFIDALRCRNGNLEIVMARKISAAAEEL